MKRIFSRTNASWILHRVFRQSLGCGIPVVCTKTAPSGHYYFRGNSTISSASKAGPATRVTYSHTRAFHDVSPSSDIQEENLGDNVPSSSCQSNNNNSHTPVMVEEVLSVLEPKENQVIIDMTFGSGGHTKEILRRCPLLKHIIALDRDPLAYQLALDLSAQSRPGQILPFLGTFEDLPSLLSKEKIPANSIDGILIDAGVSSMQLDTAERGFSLSKDGYLDMRMDTTRNNGKPTAATVVNTLDEKNLCEIIKKYGEEKNAFKIAQAIIEARAAFGRIETTKQLATVVASVFESPVKMDKLERAAHVATKTFQALRIFVNNELNQLSNGLHVAHHYLRPGGKCVVLAFHSLEDRIVKRHFHGIDLKAPKNMTLSSQTLQNSGKVFDNESLQNIVSRKWIPLKKKMTTAGEEEVRINPRSRSAKLRAATKS